MAGFRINPTANDLWLENAVVSGRNHRYRVDPVRGTLSIKSMLTGEATWETDGRRLTVSPETCLTLNDGQTYCLEIDSPEVVHTFCVFFRPGFVEEAYASRGLRGNIGFYERLRLTPRDLSLGLEKLKILCDEGSIDGLEADEAMAELALSLVAGETGDLERSGLEVVNAATRDEVFCQLNWARDYALSNLGSRLTLDDLARVACISPFYFHRLHRQAFRETPHEFVTRARVNRASRLLKAGKEVGEVAVELGFESVPTFSRLFKGRTGSTPGAFRKIG